MSTTNYKYGSVANQQLKITTRKQEKQQINELLDMEENLARTVYPSMSGIYDSYAIITEEALEAKEHMNKIHESTSTLWDNMTHKDKVEFHNTIDTIETEAVKAIEELLQLVAVCRKSRSAIPKENDVVVLEEV